MSIHNTLPVCNITSRNDIRLDHTNTKENSIYTTISTMGNITIEGKLNTPTIMNKIDARDSIHLENVNHINGETTRAKMGDLSGENIAFSGNLVVRDDILLENVTFTAGCTVKSEMGSLFAKNCIFTGNIEIRDDISLENVTFAPGCTLVSKMGRLFATNCLLPGKIEIRDDVVLNNVTMAAGHSLHSMMGQVTANNHSHLGHVKARDDITTDGTSTVASAKSTFGETNVNISKNSNWPDPVKFTSSAQQPSQSPPPAYAEQDPNPAAGGASAAPVMIGGEPCFSDYSATQEKTISQKQVTEALSKLELANERQQPLSVEFLKTVLDKINANSISSGESSVTGANDTNRSEASASSAPVRGTSHITSTGNNIYLTEKSLINGERPTAANLGKLLREVRDSGSGLFLVTESKNYYIKNESNNELIFSADWNRKGVSIGVSKWRTQDLSLENFKIQDTCVFLTTQDSKINGLTPTPENLKDQLDRIHTNGYELFPENDEMTYFIDEDKILSY